MKKNLNFARTLLEEIKKDELLITSNALSYNLLLGLFPFIIFLMAILGFLNIDASGILEGFYNSLPPQIFNVVTLFVNEVLLERNFSLLSTSLAVTIFSSSSGFKAIIHGINKSYGNEETRTPVRIRLLSVGLVFLFTFAIAVCMVVIIFGDYIINLINNYYVISGHKIIGFIRGFGALSMLLAAVTVIYRLSSSKKISIISVVPGACVTTVCWVLASKFFGIYIANFSKFSIIYGSLGSVFVLMLWLNIISFVLLLGSEINALLEVK